ncbi:hypothetical protein VHEMI03112 [[Torrubiella] hemipterigena]|uniref:Heterokaryon incompatibility domain-containing protein n=1 Tax=[Torrubiella] hemipterigena TaxID=1531966 RepID=A0A0A1T9X0_9HYPO|nr:hypothetical protein VHEMI03112 [[Torrubiella] hemipterigena]
MLCKICTTGLQGIWDPTKAHRVALLQDFQEHSSEEEGEVQEDKFVTRVDTYQAVEHNPEALHPEKYVFGHHKSRESFERSVRNGCVMCKIFAADVDSPEGKIATYGYFSLFAISFQENPVMFVYVNGASGGFELCRHVEDNNWNLDISPSTGDDKTWKIIQSWLNTCIESHNRCNRQPPDKLMPDRLIQIQQQLDGDLTFQIVPGTQVGLGSRYIAVSHCCNDADNVKLTRQNLDQHSSPQSWTLLPLTFRQTLAVAARLGVAHIWIDQLCTVQDDAAEVAAATAKRADVFRNSFLAVGVSGTTSASSGLFSTRDPFLVAPTVFDFPIDTDGTTVPHLSSCEHPEGWESAFNANPLSHSAQAISDRILAPRMVHFGSTMVFWECHHSKCAEIHPHGVHKPELGSIYKLLGVSNQNKAPESDGKWTHVPWKSLINAASRDAGHGPIHQVFYDWVRLLETYAGCKSTTARDKLEGLQGIAEHMRLMLQERGCTDIQYAAGMWQALLPGSLMWTVDDGTRIVSADVPSWSWASLDGKLNFPVTEPFDGEKEDMLCEFVKFESQHEGNPLKERLVVKGKLALAHLHPRMTSPRFHGDPKVLIRQFVDEDVPEVCLGKPFPEFSTDYDYEWAVRFDTEADIAEAVLCLPLRLESADRLGYTVHGLALTRLDDGTLCRRGTWRTLVDSREEGLGIFAGLPERSMTLV